MHAARNQYCGELYVTVATDRQVQITFGTVRSHHIVTNC